MALECDGPDRAIRNGCRLQCWLRNGEDLLGGQVDWAGLPVNLDFAFSRDQRDKVYAQHLMRRRGKQFGLGRRGAHLCVCDIAVEHDDAKTLQMDAP